MFQAVRNEPDGLVGKMQHSHIKVAGSIPMSATAKKKQKTGSVPWCEKY
jgi:hypothetical protein